METGRMTYRQKVLAIYPDAFLNNRRRVMVWLPVKDNSSYVVGYDMTAFPDDPEEYSKLTWEPTWSANEAWKRAWITTQRWLLEKLAE